MKKFTTLLSLVAVVASALFVSCAQKKEPDLVAAFPKHHYATYDVNTKGVYDWTWDSAYSFSQAKGVGFVKSTQDASILNFRVTPNADWEMYITDGAEYVDLRTGEGYKEENYTYGDAVSGVQGLSTVGIRLVKQPTIEEGEKTVNIVLAMAGDKLLVATLTIAPAPEIPETPEEGGEEGGEEA